MAVRTSPLLTLTGLLAGCSGDGPEAADPCSSPAAPTWSNFAEGYITTWCTSCHSASVTGLTRNGAPEGVNFDQWSEVHAWRARIAAVATGVDRTMPPLDGVGEDDVARLAQWLACDAPGSDTPPGPCEVLVEGAAATVSSQAEADTLCATANVVAGLTVNGTASIDCLCSVRGDLVVTGGDVDLPLVSSVSGDLRVEGTAGAVRAPELTTVAGAVFVTGPLSELGLASMQTVGGDLVLADLPALSSVSFDGLLAVDGRLTVHRSAGMTVVDMPRLRDVGLDLTIEDLPVLVRIDGSRTLERIGGSLILRRLPRLAMLDDFGFLLLEEVGGDVIIQGNTDLAGVHGFTLLSDVGANLVLTDNPNLLRIDGFDSVVHVGGDLRFQRNMRQSSVFGFVNLEQVDGDLVLEDLPSVMSLLGFEAVTRVGGLRMVRIGPAASLWFDPLEIVMGDLVIRECPSMAFVAGFAALTAVGGDIELVGNPLVGAIDGWIGIDTVGGAVTVSGNPSLPGSAITGWLQAVGHDDIGGPITVYDNGLD